MTLLKDCLFFTYLAILVVLSLYGAHRYQLMYLYYRHRHNDPKPAGRFTSLPRVTVQLPLFNEATVVERLLDSVAAIDYPKELLEVQVLDDSTDETQALAKARVKEWRARGLDIVYLHRDQRDGFKAGALKAGLERAKGELILIFDADFIPPRDVLTRTIDFFTDEKIGMVQIRWAHLNRDYSLLTRLQSVLLDGHFVIEHTARHRSGRHFNFNGTCGVWRRAAIESSGGWQHDTLTEDLDLSYRAKIHGWSFVYLLDYAAPGELPVEMNAFKSQQHRWAKGSIQTARKVLPGVWRSLLPFKVKVEATFHLTANLAYPLLLVLLILLLPVLLIRLSEVDHALRSLVFDLSIFVLATLSVCSFYLVALREVDRNWTRALKYLPAVLSLGTGLAINNSRAVIEALVAHDTPFVRTPKYNVIDQVARGPIHRYRSTADWMPWTEVGFGLYLMVILGVSLQHQLWLMSFFMTLFACGFLYVGLSSLLQRRGHRRPE